MKRIAIRWTIVLVSMLLVPFAAADDAVPTGRLPRTVVPQRVALDLELDATREAFRGRVAIEVDVTAATDTIWMHGRDLRIERARFVPENGEEQKLDARQVHESGVLKLAAGRPLPKGRGRIEIDYAADYSEALQGAYRVKSVDAHYVMTQMEPLGARGAFPSFDEPAFKQPWEISITVPEGQVAIANTHQVASSDAGGGRRRLQFATTEPLSSYLVAFVVGPWDVVDAPPLPPTAVRKVPVALRGIAAKGKGKELEYALRHTPAIVTALEEYFGIPYPFDKLDIVAAPDFAFGAMENAGLIIYRDTLLLSIDKTSAKLQAAYWAVHAHELAHQWFGNLVTMPWWDDIWLNEAFASWLENRIAHGLRPEFHFDRVVVADGIRAMTQDSLASTRRIREPVVAHTDVLSAFDGITYSKGAMVLAMFEAYLGETAFRDAIRAHMRKYAGGTATSTDLMASLAAGRKDGPRLEASFRTFVDQPGVPLVHADLRCDGGKPRVELRQRRYVPLGSTIAAPAGAAGATTAQAQWIVPICLRYGDAETTHRQCLLLEQREATVALDTDRCPQWLMPNADAGGYYRYALAADDAKALATAFPGLTAVEQLAFADSLIGAFEAGDTTIDALIDALPALAASPVREVAIAPFATITWLRENAFETAAQRAEFDARIAAAWRPALVKLGYAGRASDTVEQRAFRSDVLAFFAETVLDVDVRRRLAEAGRRVVDGNGKLVPDAVEPDLRGLALRMTAALGGAQEFERIERHARATTDPLLRRQLLTALGAFEQPALAARARDIGLDAHWPPSLVTTSLIEQMSRPAGRAAARRWLRERHADLSQRLPAVHLSNVPAYDAKGLCSADDAAALDAFYAPKMATVDAGPRALAQAVEAVRLCASLAAHVRAQRQPVAVVEPWRPKNVASARFESHPAFDPRTGELYFVRSSPQFSGWRILTSACTGDGWSAPRDAGFAGDGVEADPWFDRDGDTLWFISTRTTDGNTRKGLDIWRVQRSAGAWGRPERLPDPVNSDGNEWFPRVAPDGWLWFGSDRTGGLGRTDLWRARRDASGEWQVENAGPALNGPGEEYEPQHAPDGKSLVMMGEGGLYESRLVSGAWTPKRRLPAPIVVNGSEIGPLFSPSGDSLMFARDLGGEQSGELFVWRRAGHEAWPPACP